MVPVSGLVSGLVSDTEKMATQKQKNRITEGNAGGR